MKTAAALVGTTPDARLTAALGRALGPLAGNPSYLLAMIDEMRRANRLVMVARPVRLRHPHRTPALPSDSPPLAAVGERGGLAEHDGALGVRCPAADATLRERASARRIRELHAAVARAAAGPAHDELAPLDPGVPADHVAAAGEALAPDPGQIARLSRMSEKTVENHLTRLFVRFGCCTHHGLVTARLTARRDELEVGA